MAKKNKNNESHKTTGKRKDNSNKNSNRVMEKKKSSKSQKAVSKKSIKDNFRAKSRQLLKTKAANRQVMIPTEQSTERVIMQSSCLPLKLLQKEKRKYTSSKKTGVTVFKSVPQFNSDDMQIVKEISTKKQSSKHSKLSRQNLTSSVQYTTPRTSKDKQVTIKKIYFPIISMPDDNVLRSELTFEKQKKRKRDLKKKEKSDMQAGITARASERPKESAIISLSTPSKPKKSRRNYEKRQLIESVNENKNILLINVFKMIEEFYDVHPGETLLKAKLKAVLISKGYKREKDQLEGLLKNLSHRNKIFLTEDNQEIYKI